MAGSSHEPSEAARTAHRASRPRCLEARFAERAATASRCCCRTRRCSDFPPRLTDRLEHWVLQAPDRTLAARRDQRRRLGPHQLCADARARAGVGQALVERGLSAERPVAILSDNDLEHLTLALGAMWAGIPFVPISPAYSLISQDYGKLRHILGRITPGLVFASGPAYARAIDGDRCSGHRGGDDASRRTSGGAATPFGELLATPPGAGVDAAHARVGPQTIVKFLFTSGSTKLPKGVINTHRMICANQQMMRQALAFLADEPPVLVDWLPWNHTFGGNHNVGITHLQRRHALHRRRQGRRRRRIAETLAQPARDLADDLFQRAERLRGDRRGDGRRRRAARVAVPPRAGLHVRRRRPVAGGVGPARPPGRAGGRRAHPDVHRPGHDRDGAELHVRDQGAGAARGPHRPAVPRRRGQAGAASTARPRSAFAAPT